MSIENIKAAQFGHFTAPKIKIGAHWCPKVAQIMPNKFLLGAPNQLWCSKLAGSGWIVVGL
jgi:hypothetical protein